MPTEGDVGSGSEVPIDIALTVEQETRTGQVTIQWTLNPITSRG